MGDVAGCSSRGRYCAYDAVRVVLGLVLLTAAALKAHQLAAEPVVGATIMESRWFLILVVEWEFLLAFWLWTGVYPSLGHHVCLCCFCLFALIAIGRELAGEKSCGCFGRATVPPLATTALDLAALAALLHWRPLPHPRPAFPSRAWHCVALTLLIWTLLTIPVTLVMAGRTATYLAESGEIIGTDTAIVLTPEAWIGRPLPLLHYTDIGTTLSTGRWSILLFHHDCPRCQVAIERICSPHRERSSDSPFALIELPPYGLAMEELTGVWPGTLYGRLDYSRNWIVDTPTRIHLINGVVSDVISRDQDGGDLE